MLRGVWQQLRSLSALVSLASISAAGFLGAIVMVAVGPYLAMGLQIWTGNTEPSRPRLPYPAVALFVALMLPVPWIRRRSWAGASVAALPLAVLPYVYLWQLYGIAGR